MDPPIEERHDELDILFATDDFNHFDTSLELSGAHESASELEGITKPYTTTTAESSLAIPRENIESTLDIENPSNLLENAWEDTLLDTSFDDASETFSHNLSTMHPENSTGTAGGRSSAHDGSKLEWNTTNASETHPDDDSKPAASDSLKKTNGSRSKGVPRDATISKPAAAVKTTQLEEGRVPTCPSMHVSDPSKAKTNQAPTAVTKGSVNTANTATSAATKASSRENGTLFSDKRPAIAMFGHAQRAHTLDPPMLGYAPADRKPVPQDSFKQIIDFSTNGRAVTQSGTLHQRTSFANQATATYHDAATTSPQTDNIFARIGIRPNAAQLQQPWPIVSAAHLAHATQIMPTSTVVPMRYSMQPLPGARATPHVGNPGQKRPFVPPLTTPVPAYAKAAPEKRNKTPFKPHSRIYVNTAALKSVEKDDSFQPFANKSGDYYLCDDEVLVEEDPLPAHPAGRYAQALAKKTALPHASSLAIHAIPLRMVGGLQDQVHVTKLACGCKGVKRRSKGSGSVCLKLYCDCFATGYYCNENCNCAASCFNSAAEPNVQPRTQAIVEVLKQDPHAFRHAYASIAQRQKEHRIRLIKAEARAVKSSRQKPLPRALSGSKSSSNSVKNIGTVKQAHNIVALAASGKTNKTKDYDADDEDPSAIPPVAVLTTQLPPSYYTVPLKVDGGSTVLMGLSFSLTHPRNRKKLKPDKKQLYQEPMLSSDKNPPELPDDKETRVNAEGPAASSDARPEPKKRRIGDTQLQTFWNVETQTASVYFQAIRAKLDGSQKPWSWFPYEKTQQQAVANFSAIKDDIESIKTVVVAAKIDIMARFYQENRLKRGYFAEAVDPETAGAEVKRSYGCDLQDDEASRLLQCDEQLASNEQNLPVANDTNFKDLTILAAQDTALLQETARIIRRMARQLCERRIQKYKP